MGTLVGSDALSSAWLSTGRYDEQGLVVRDRGVVVSHEFNVQDSTFTLPIPDP